ncbi:gamma-glutamyl-gamma-aminobutyrate hydrolase family protein [Planctomonas psychrotolerans]|uniref:gamma-glutamyl-gamma-aminobutyrate hydrolase family protein n=1 Tax=Planctomonas psychrotolerans TaxID=2528712 RepID=UPI001D0D7675|nr:gamma-glutamyl-gamma-aminobutyrate hydrolase family protein [Planctomonas psychrotolerans]
MVSSDSDFRPLIGITTYLEQAQTGVWDVRAAFLPEVYLQSVTDAGGIAVLLPPQPVSDGVIDRILDSLDGLVLSGGADVDPALYGHPAHERTSAPRTDRDTWEVALIRRAVETGKPFLAICRGAQLLNVALGGTLHQHLPDVVGTERYQPGPARFGEIDVSVEWSSRLGRVLGGTAANLSVQCYHHQALDRVADGLTVSARADDDGVIQAVELADSPFGIGVQWHPEQDAVDRRLFEGLVKAAR